MGARHEVVRPEVPMSFRSEGMAHCKVSGADHGGGRDRDRSRREPRPAEEISSMCQAGPPQSEPCAGAPRCRQCAGGLQSEPCAGSRCYAQMSAGRLLGRLPPRSERRTLAVRLGTFGGDAASASGAVRHCHSHGEKKPCVSPPRAHGRRHGRETSCRSCVGCISETHVGPNHAAAASSTRRCNAEPCAGECRALRRRRRMWNWVGPRTKGIGFR